MAVSKKNEELVSSKAKEALVEVGKKKESLVEVGKKSKSVVKVAERRETLIEEGTELDYRRLARSQHGHR